MKRFNWFEILLVSVLMSISLYAALSDSQNLSWRWFTRDDAYYYFKVAQNISEGNGSTFDGINPTNGYHPLWMLVCVPIFALARFDVILPLRILLLVMGAFSAATAVLFSRLIGRVFHPVVGALAAIFWAFNYDLLTRVYMQGLETGLAVFFVLLLVYKLYEFETSWRKEQVTNRQLLILGLIALLTVFSRLDLIFLAGIVGIWIVFRGTPLRYLLPLDIASLLVSSLLAFTLRLSFPAYYRFADAAVAMAAVSLMVKLPLAYFLGLYQPIILSNARQFVTRLFVTVAAGSALTAVLMFFLSWIAHFEGFPRIAIFYDLIFTTFFLGLSRLGILGLKTKPATGNTMETPLEQLRQNWNQWLKSAIPYFGVVGAGMALYMLYNKLAFGTFSPVSGQIKRWWGSLSGRVYDGPASNPLTFYGLTYDGDGNAWHPVSTLFGSWVNGSLQFGIPSLWRYLILLTVFAMLFYALFYVNRHKAKSVLAQLGFIPLFTAVWMQVLYYHAPGYSAYKEWYWVGQLVLIVLTLSMILGLLFRNVQKRPYIQQAAWVAVAAFGLYMLLPFWSSVQSKMAYNRWSPTDPNNDIAAFLEANTEPGSIIGFTGGGNAGYFIHDRIVINMDGLINSNEYFQNLKDKQAGEYLAGQGMNYILANSMLLDQIPYKGQFFPYTEPTGTSYGGKDLLRFHIP